MNEPMDATILAVDDDATSRKILDRVLARAGFRVVMADSGISALEILSRTNPDLILLDVMMPGMDGYELCAELQANPDTADIPVIFITALGEQHDKTRSFALGAVDYVTKPIQPQTLSQVVGAQLKTSQRWKNLSEHRSALKGKASIAPTDFTQFRQFLSQQFSLTADGQKTCAALTPGELYAALTKLGFGENQVALSIANFMKLAYLPFIEPEDVQVGILSPPFARANLAVAIQRDGKNMFALSNPFDRGLIESLTKFSGLGDQFILGITAPKNISALFTATTANTQQAPSRDRPPATGLPQPSLHQTQPSNSSLGFANRTRVAGGLRAVADSNPALAKLDALSRDTQLETESVLQLADRLLERAVSERASDIHIEPEAADAVIRFRVDGDMREILSIKSDVNLMLMSRLKALGGMDIAERRRPQDGACEVKIAGRPFKIRLATTSTPDGESLIMRVLEPGTRAKSLTELGMTEEQSRAMTVAASSTQGLILIVGPTGSGKTTTIFSVLSQVDTRTRSLVSVEDPVEYRIPFANQQQVNEKAGINFESLLKSAMRQDPDILFLGEIRDTFSGKASMDFASTGHLTISTLHTSNATSAIFRLERLGVTRTMMSDAILCIVAQRLLRKLCSHCKEVVPITDREAERLAPFISQVPPEVAQPVGCAKCNQSGYLGREGIYEVIKFDAEIADMLHTNKSVSAIREFAYRRGDFLISHHAAEKVAQMLVSVDDAYQKALAEEAPPEVSVASPKGVPRTASPAQEKAKAASTTASVPSILLVEDDKDNRALIQRYLVNQGYDVTVADDGVDALMQLGRAKFDLILTDVNMPTFDGFKLLEAARQKKIDTPMVFLTAETDEAAEIKGLELGVADYLKKPVRKELFLLRIKKILGR
ncbi:MAG: response regulator [Deltaproteobacteria bacterium]|nr:MAG: response regulator [Deltaproteobacteria bacterium]